MFHRTNESCVACKLFGLAETTRLGFLVREDGCGGAKRDAENEAWGVDKTAGLFTDHNSTMSYPNPAPAAPPRMGLQESLERLLHSHRLLTRDIEFVATTRGTMSWPMFCDAARELHVHVVRDGGYRPSEVITPLLVMGRDFWAELWYDNACGVWVWKLMCKPALPRMSRLKRVEHAVHAVKADVLAKPPPPMQATVRSSTFQSHHPGVKALGITLIDFLARRRVMRVAYHERSMR